MYIINWNVQSVKKEWKCWQGKRWEKGQLQNERLCVGGSKEGKRIGKICNMYKDSKVLLTGLKFQWSGSFDEEKEENA